MLMQPKKPIPQVIASLIEIVDDKGSPEHIRVNARDTLQNISDEAFRAVKRLDKELGIKRPKLIKAE